MATKKYLTCPNDGSPLILLVEGMALPIKVYRRRDGGIANGPLYTDMASIKAWLQREYPDGDVIRDEEELLGCMRCDYAVEASELTRDAP